MTMKPLNNEGEYYMDKDVAQLLGITPGRLRNKLTAGDPLPPRIQPPGFRKRLWPRSAVHAWLDQFVVMGAEPPLHHSLLQRRHRYAKR